MTVALIEAPDDFERKLNPLPENVELRDDARKKSAVVILFAANAADLMRRFPPAAAALNAGGALWLAYPKKASGAKTDLTQQAVREYGMSRDFVDYKICSIDETWTGLCFARRK